jgi:hypothetical protein
LGYNPGVTSATLGDQVSGFTLSYLDINGSCDDQHQCRQIHRHRCGENRSTSGQTISQRTRIALRNGG